MCKLNSGALVILNNELYELLRIDFGCICTLRKFYDEGEIELIQEELKVVQKAYKYMEDRGVKL